ncbi:MAG: FkbM family methyltransferase [Caulobacterales bacterium]
MTATGLGAQIKLDGQSALVRAVGRFPWLGLPLFKLYMIVRFLVQRTTTVRLYYGATIKIDLWQMMLQRMFYFRCWEPNISSLVEDILRRGDVFVDLGAHIGYYTLLASKLVGSEGAVVAVEALPSNFAMLQENVSQNAAGNVRAVNCAVSDRRGDLTIFSGAFRNTGTATTIELPGRAVVGRVASLPLDEILTGDERARVALIKIDIEGRELQVLQRLLETLDAYPAGVQVICEFDTLIGGEALRAAFLGFLAVGFEAYRIPNDYSWESYLRWRGPEPLAKVTDLPPGGCDILFRPADRSLT